MATLQRCACGLFIVLVAFCVGREALAVVRVVSTTAQFSSALAAAGTGDEIICSRGCMAAGIIGPIFRR
jgi:hypothetical protein